MKKGLYIVFEGVVGSGKTTQAKLLVENLRKNYPKRKVVLTHEPGGSEIADSIRRLVQGTTFGEEMEPMCETYLYAASRAQTLRRVVKPVLDSAGIVIADRSYLSSIANQGSGGGMSHSVVMKVNQSAIGGITPDVVFFFDIDPSIGLRRIGQRDGDKFETRGVEYHEKVRKGYLVAAKNFPRKWVTVKADCPVEVIQTRIYSKVTRLLGRSVRHKVRKA